MTSFLDTNVVAYAYDHNAGRKHEKAVSLLENLAGDAAISTQVLLEFHAVATSKLGLSRGEAANAVKLLSRMPVIPTDKSLVLAAAETAELADLSIWDAMIVQAAFRGGCDTLYTENLNAGQKINGVEIVDPFE